jgi:hypothetical protein
MRPRFSFSSGGVGKCVWKCHDLRMAQGDGPWEELRARSAFEGVVNFQLWFGETLLLGAETWVRFLERAARDVDQPQKKLIRSSSSGEPDPASKAPPPQRLGSAEHSDPQRPASNIQEILANALRDAFDAGRRRAASDLKSGMASLFEEPARGEAAPQGGSSSQGTPEEGQHSDDAHDEGGRTV